MTNAPAVLPSSCVSYCVFFQCLGRLTMAAVHAYSDTDCSGRSHSRPARSFRSVMTLGFMVLCLTAPAYSVYPTSHCLF
ncbi:hypothetical protein BP00DRAFT_424314 [Aspergillus indologenus CBS 114.80]|uniref:Uncharacterized protein n=1 Tax=Aspergillus indologenus CBS 114.80 TaxID=1450541 RepID=A0A2V5I954_9EURO|nr:hypothetical protein BP00DRAFT_424314 [Aspergillus indologenus CBS 114.80]